MLQFYEEKWKPLNKIYEISSHGRFKRLYKYKFKILKSFRKGSLIIIKLKLEDKAKDYNVAKLVAENFIRSIKSNEVIYHKNGVISDNNIINLEIITRSESGKRTGYLSKRKSIVLLDDDGVISKMYKGTRDAAAKLFISRQTVCDYCNNKTKKKMCNIVWAEDLI